MPERPLAERLGYDLLKKVNKAVHKYDLIGDGDRIVVAVSGRSDSLSLLQLLQTRQLRPGQRLPSAPAALPQQPDLQTGPNAGHLAGTGKRPSEDQKQPPSRPSESQK